MTSAGGARRTVDVLFPAWTSAAMIDAALHDGSRVAVGAGPISLSRVAWFHLRGERSGYVVVVADRTEQHATARALSTAPLATSRASGRRSRCGSSAPRASAGAR